MKLEEMRAVDDALSLILALRRSAQPTATAAERLRRSLRPGHR